MRGFKPDICTHEGLFDLERATKLPMRFAWPGLFTEVDREGRFKWRPRELKTHILPYDEIDFAAVLDAFWLNGFIRKYVVDGETYGYIPTWKKHQHINKRETRSMLPAPTPENEVRPPRLPLSDADPLEIGSGAPAAHVHTPVTHVRAHGKGKERKGSKTRVSNLVAAAGENASVENQTPNRLLLLLAESVGLSEAKAGEVIAHIGVERALALMYDLRAKQNIADPPALYMRKVLDRDTPSSAGLRWAHQQIENPEDRAHRQQQQERARDYGVWLDMLESDLVAGKYDRARAGVLRDVPPAQLSQLVADVRDRVQHVLRGDESRISQIEQFLAEIVAQPVELSAAQA